MGVFCCYCCCFFCVVSCVDLVRRAYVGGGGCIGSFGINYFFFFSFSLSLFSLVFYLYFYIYLYGGKVLGFGHYYDTIFIYLYFIILYIYGSFLLCITG